MSISLLSTLCIPSVIFVKIIGNIVSIPMKIGTDLEVNHMRANKIKETIGTERISTIQGFMKVSKEGFNPAMMPNVIPAIIAMRKPIIPRKMVLPMVMRKSLLENKLIAAFSDSKGPGMICLEPTLIEMISQRMSISTIELMTIYVFLLLIKFFIWHFISNYLRIHLEKYVKILFYYIFDIFAFFNF